MSRVPEPSLQSALSHLSAFSVLLWVSTGVIGGIRSRFFPDNEYEAYLSRIERFHLYLWSFIIPLLGVIAGIRHFRRSPPYGRRVAWGCFMASAANALVFLTGLANPYFT